MLEHNKVDKLYLLAEDDDVSLSVSCPYEIVNYSGQKYYGYDCPNMQTRWNIIPLVYTLIPELVSADRIIYLDMDTVICEDLSPIWNLDLEGKWGAWCPETEGDYRPFGTDKKYYNGGVAVMNLEQMRRDHVTEMLVELLNKETYLYSGQDALNQIFTEDKVVDLPARYNECFYCGYTDKPAIIHYAGMDDWFDNNTMPRWEELANLKSKWK